MKKKHKIKYPPYPSSNWDASVVETARQHLVKPNRCICIYCWGQAVKEEDVVHTDDCPTRGEE